MAPQRDKTKTSKAVARLRQREPRKCATGAATSYEGEFSVVLGEALAQKLGLFHNPLGQVDAYRNKRLMRALFTESGVDQPRVLAHFTNMEDVDRFAWESLRFPVIVKPVDMSASAHVRSFSYGSATAGLLAALASLGIASQ